VFSNEYRCSGSCVLEALQQLAGLRRTTAEPLRLTVLATEARGRRSIVKGRVEHGCLRADTVRRLQTLCVHDSVWMHGECAVHAGGVCLGCRAQASPRAASRGDCQCRR
jgi:hypothetical protein